MNNYNLSEGALAVIMSGGTVNEPIMQVLGSKKIMGSAEKERFRLLVSDGKYQISFAMIATQINEKITSGELTANAVIKIKKYITSMINNAGKGDRRVMVILDLEILVRGEDVGNRIGNPVALPDDPTILNKLKPANAPATNGASANSSSLAKPAQASAPTPAVKPFMQNSLGADQTILPVSNLNPYQNRWVIRVRVLNKSPVRTWSNSRGEGKLFTVDFADETGEIRATAFRDAVDKFYDLLQIDMVYYLSKCTVKTANKQFTNIKHDYELTFTNETTVTTCTDEVCVPKIFYSFVPISEIPSKEVGDIIDVIGVCKSASDVQILQAKSTNRELKKREITLVDQSNNSNTFSGREIRHIYTECSITDHLEEIINLQSIWCICMDVDSHPEDVSYNNRRNVALTLWAAEAENFNSQGQPVLAVRGAKVGEFGGGKNISVLVSSVVKQNPDIPEAHQLKGWFESGGKNADSNNISARSGLGNLRTDWLSLLDVKEKRLGSGDNADYYQCKATILLVNSNNAIYKACPTEECNKKVIDLENGQYRCEKCNREYPRFKYRLIMSLNIGDWSDNQWVSMFAAEAEKILGMTSQEFGETTENDKDALAAICGKANFTEFIFRCRAKLETYNDETRLKNVVVRVDPINYKEYHSFMISSVKQALKL